MSLTVLVLLFTLDSLLTVFSILLVAPNFEYVPGLVPEALHILSVSLHISLNQITVVPPYLWGICSKTPSGRLRPQIVPHPRYAIVP